MNELNHTDNSITSRQPNKLLRIILYGNLSLKIKSTSGFWLQLFNSSKIVIDVINP